MGEYYSYEGLVNGGTFKVDETTKTAIEDSPTDLIDKVVTLTGNFEVGYGSSGNRPLGFVETVELEGFDNGDKTFVVSVLWNKSAEDIPCAGSETAGSYLACDGKGGLTTSSSATNAVAYGVDAENKTCVAYIHG